MISGSWRATSPANGGNEVSCPAKVSDHLGLGSQSTASKRDVWSILFVGWRRTDVRAPGKRPTVFARQMGVLDRTFAVDG
jgi:hypothetical protein